MSLTEIKQVGGGTVWGESDDFDFSCAEVMGGLSIWKYIEFTWEHFFLLILLDTFKHKSRVV